jgi:hypothetical protein
VGGGNPVKWYPSAEFGFQAGHFLLGYAAVVTATKWLYCLAATGIALLYMLIKEFSFDMIVEGDTVETGWKDTAYLVGGIALAWAVFYLRTTFIF